MQVLNEEKKLKQIIISLSKKFDELKYENIFIYDVKNKLYYTDYVILITANSLTQLNSSDNVLKKLEKEFSLKKRITSHKNIDSGWLVYDYSDFIIHIFTGEKRDYYKIDEIFNKYEKMDYKND